MKALYDYFAMGVEWTGIIPATPGTKETPLNAAEALSRRHVRVVLLHIAQRYPTRAAQIERGLHLSRVDLSNRLYGLSVVADALNILQRAGIVRRERQRGGARGATHEERARTHVHPDLIEQARGWDAERAERYKRGLRGAAASTKKTATLHLVWNEAKLEASNDAGSNGACVRNSEGSASEIRTHLLHTPPPAAAPPPEAEQKDKRRKARPPRARGGVSLPEEEMITRDEWKKELKAELELAGADRFFKFMAQNGVKKWFCDAQSRKKDGQRGAPLGGIFGMAFPIESDKLLDGFAELQLRIERAKKTKIDLATKEASIENCWRTILIDDLSEHQLDSIRTFWPGPTAIIETSPQNYQVLLISPRPLNRDERLQAARFLVGKFGGDPGAVAPSQLHRFPGSPNWKPAVVNDGRPFVTRLIACYDGEEGFDLAEQLDEMLSSLATVKALGPRRQKAMRQAAGNAVSASGDNSSEAFRWTLRQLACGTPHATILASLQTRWLGHHDDKDWPARTLHNALHARGARATRYSAG